MGGNLSEGFHSIDWSAAQQAGTVDGAVESAVGVLLYQMGMAAFVPLAFYFGDGAEDMAALRLLGKPDAGACSLGVMVALVNGMFQEEALFAPPALGLLCCLPAW